MTFPLFPRQIEYLRESDAFLNIADGAVRSGKSVAQNWRWIDHLSQMPVGGLYLMTGTTQDTVVRNVLAPMQAVFGQSRVRWSLGPDSHATILGRQCPIIGANNVRSENTIRGMTLGGWYADEVTLHPESVFDMARTRLSEPGAKAFVSCNPDSPLHWLARNHMSDEALSNPRQVKRFRFSLADNPGLDPAYIEMLTSSFSGLFRRRMIDGEWVVAEGVIFDMFDEAKHVCVLPELSPYYVLSCDYGTSNPFVMGLWGRNGAGWHKWSEYVWDSSARGKQKTDDEYSDAVVAWLAGFASDHDIPAIHPVHAWVDPSAASFIIALRRRGLSVLRARNDVLPGIRRMSTMLSEGLMTFDPSCTFTLSEFPVYTWDRNAQDRGEDKPLKVHDHAMDECRYLAFSEREGIGSLKKPSGW